MTAEALRDALLERLYPVAYHDPSTGEPIRLGGAWEAMDQTKADLDAIIEAAKAEARAESEAQVAGLREALEAIRDELDTGWEHGEECGVWADDDVTGEPLYPGDLPGRHDACDCGVGHLLRQADAALEAPAPDPRCEATIGTGVRCAEPKWSALHHDRGLTFHHPFTLTPEPPAPEAAS